MKVLALDVSTNTGWALLEGELGSIPKIVDTGTVQLEGGPVSGFGDMRYPWDYTSACETIAHDIAVIVNKLNPDRIVIEETNRPGRFTSRYSQKILEFIHAYLLEILFNRYVTDPKAPAVHYVNTSDWRKLIGANLTKADKALNIKVRKLKKAGNKEALKALGVRGKISKKHVAIRYVNATFGTDFKMKDNDICDAICQGTAYFLGVKVCDGKR
jgi:hypothetical protein